MQLHTDTGPTSRLIALRKRELLLILPPAEQLARAEAAAEVAAKLEASAHRALQSAHEKLEAA
eukprot:11334024-Prorocentrum_lima.AAC.1